MEQRTDAPGAPSQCDVPGRGWAVLDLLLAVRGRSCDPELEESSRQGPPSCRLTACREPTRVRRPIRLSELVALLRDQLLYELNATQHLFQGWAVLGPFIGDAGADEEVPAVPKVGRCHEPSHEGLAVRGNRLQSED